MTRIAARLPHSDIPALTSELVRDELDASLDPDRRRGDRIDAGSRSALEDLAPAEVGRRWWVSAAIAAWRLLSWAGEGGTIGRYPVPDWLRRDLGLTEDDMTSLSDRIYETRQKYSWWR
jgi:hypothetical protein